MTDKERTVLIVASNFGTINEASQQILNQLILEGNTQLLALRKASLKSTRSLFNAITSLSQIDGEDLSQKIQAQLVNMG